MSLKKLFIIIGCLVATSTFAQQDFSKVQIETIPVAKGVYMLVGSGGNIGLSVGQDGAFLIDDQYAPLYTGTFVHNVLSIEVYLSEKRLGIEIRRAALVNVFENTLTYKKKKKSEGVKSTFESC